MHWKGDCIHIYPSDIKSESRIRRHCLALEKAGGFNEIIFFGCPTDEERVEHFSESCRAEMVRRSNVQGRGLIKKYLSNRQWCRKVFALAAGRRVDCISCHSLPTLPLCVRLKRFHGAKLVYEPHELETETAVSRGVRRLFSRMVESWHIKNCDAVITVNESISNWYRDAYSIPMPAAVRNVPPIPRQREAVEEGNHFRHKFNIPDEALIYLYQGWIGAGRRIEEYLKVFSQSEVKRHLVFMGGFADADTEAIVRRALERHSHIHYHDAVPIKELLGYTACADVGLCGVENVCESYRLSLPNKIFEFLAAGVPCLAQDFPEIARVINRTGAGWLHGDSERELGDALAGISREAVNEKAALANGTGEIYCWEDERAVLLDTYRRVMEGGAE